MKDLSSMKPLIGLHKDTLTGPPVWLISDDVHFTDNKLVDLNPFLHAVAVDVSCGSPEPVLTAPCTLTNCTMG